MRRSAYLVIGLLVLSSAGLVSAQFPILDMIADKVVHKYQNSTCEQLWQKRANKDKPKSAREKEFMQILHNNPELRTQFINRVAAPIANKMFECGMIP